MTNFPQWIMHALSFRSFFFAKHAFLISAQLKSFILVKSSRVSCKKKRKNSEAYSRIDQSFWTRESREDGRNSQCCCLRIFSIFDKRIFTIRSLVSSSGNVISENSMQKKCKQTISTLEMLSESTFSSSRCFHPPTEFSQWKSWMKIGYINFIIPTMKFSFSPKLHVHWSTKKHQVKSKKKFVLK